MSAMQIVRIIVWTVVIAEIGPAGPIDIVWFNKTIAKLFMIDPKKPMRNTSHLKSTVVQKTIPTIQISVLMMAAVKNEI